MSKTGFAVLAITLAAMPALSQGIRANAAPSPRVLFNPIGPGVQPPNFAMSSEGRTCLVRKSTGKSECHTKYEWRRIARKIDKKSESSAR
ncbi:hypothetical protein C8J25_101916 [Sphingomonas faeni]|uniref:Ig-like domain-containing protein n=1 Tax=Sphingomonas faeni TaxID=185950 RepID=A0A2T5UD25_9SPHN|nr:hypothetical protein C8J25_101916 [Sphingomonas faeni]